MPLIKNILFLLLIACALPSCNPDDSWQEDGLAPLYVSPEDFTQIFATGPRIPVDQGSVVEENGYIYINERFEGIHVIDNTDPANAKPIYFYRIPGNSEFKVSGDFLYADNSRHLLTIDISTPGDIMVVSYIADLYSGDLGNKNFPAENYVGRFECVDFEEGIVAGWEMRLLDSPKCYM